ncbi:hypothetical protein RxyAA322_00180 [Rubrobacter xylanophilus]|uniref:Uncharacterized protein n=1 Tax=Rubrobacter xylanophilus TaxID=49319 RepID=A0A510HE17_9ACTN|nr:hypothetical protein RxyAA322_00180 [Rubrobacter xylanophilus]
MSTIPIFDGHNDTLLRFHGENRRESFFEHGERGHIDLPRVSHHLQAASGARCELEEHPGERAGPPTGTGRIQGPGGALLEGGWFSTPASFPAPGTKQAKNPPPKQPARARGR